MRYLRMKKRRSVRSTDGQLVVVPAENSVPSGGDADTQTAFPQATAEPARANAPVPNGKTRVAGLTAPYLTFPMR